MSSSAAAELPESFNLFDFVVKQGNGVKGLSDMGIESVPSQYIQPPEERLDSTKIVPQSSIPIIDFSEWDRPEVADAIFEALTKWGFFQIVNHGVPIGILDDLKAAVHRFFESSTEEKRKYLKDSPAAAESVRFVDELQSESRAGFGVERLFDNALCFGGSGSCFLASSVQVFMCVCVCVCV